MGPGGEGLRGESRLTTARMPGAWSVLATTLAIQALVSMSVLAVPAMAPALAEAVGASPAWIGIYIAFLYVGAMVVSMVSGPLVVRRGAIRVSQLGLLACAVGLAVLALWPTLWGAALAAGLIGLGYGPITPASSHLLAKSTPAHRVGLVFSIKQTGVPLGGVMAGALVPPLVWAGGVAMALWSVAAGCVACMLLAQITRAPLDADRESGHPINLARLVAPVRMVVRHPTLARLALCSLVFSALQMSLATYLVTYLHTTLGHSLIAAGAALSVAQVGGVGGRVLWGHLADRWLGARRMLAVVAGLMALSTLATAGLAVDLPQGLMLALLLTFGASATGWNGVYLAEVARLAPPGMASAATGGSLAITFFGVVLGPVVFGGIASVFDSYRAGYLVLAVPAAYCAWQLAKARPLATRA
jgi:MFS family permease